MGLIADDEKRELNFCAGEFPNTLRVMDCSQISINEVECRRKTGRYRCAMNDELIETLVSAIKEQTAAINSLSRYVVALEYAIQDNSTCNKSTQSELTALALILGKTARK
jgi:hypothetical protein